jgi:hypothetical protein
VVVREPHLPPSVADCLCADFVLCVDDPLGDLVARGSGIADVGILRHHPIKEFVAHLSFKGLVVAILDHLEKPRAACANELNLHAKDLDGVDNQPHLVDLKLV